MNMMNSDIYLKSMNPLWKVWILIIITIIATFDFKPFLSISLIILGLLIVGIFSDIKIVDMLKKLAPLSLVATGFVLVITLTRYFSGEKLNFIGTLAISLRIILIGLYSNIFVNTTNPMEFVISLNKYFGMPIIWCYSFLSAYRFLPNFKEELQVIKFAHQVRGIDPGKGVIGYIINTKRMIIPMMTTAIRKGIRVSMAMETKGFGKHSKRTNFRKISINKKDVTCFVFFNAVVMLIALILTKYNLTQFGIIYRDL